jgi:hypothetical protein
MDDLPRLTKITGPLLVFGGPYSNLEATKAILAEARRCAIPPNNIVCTGDLVLRSSQMIQFTRSRAAQTAVSR